MASGLSIGSVGSGSSGSGYNMLGFELMMERAELRGNRDYWFDLLSSWNKNAGQAVVVVGGLGTSRMYAL